MEWKNIRLFRHKENLLKYIIKNGKYTLEQNYILEEDPDDPCYNAETAISLRAFPHITMKLKDIFEKVD